MYMLQSRKGSKIVSCARLLCKRRTEEESGHMSQVFVAQQPESWLPNQIAVGPIRWYNNELVSLVTSKPSISRKLHNCYGVVGLWVASPNLQTLFLSVGDMFGCIWEASENCVRWRRQAEDAEVLKIGRYAKQVTSWWTSDPKLFFQTWIGKHASHIAPRSQQNLATCASKPVIA